MKYLILLALMVYAPNIILFSQTYISPVIGLAFSKVQSRDFLATGYENIIPLEKGYANASPQIGLRVKQRFFKKADLELTSKFSHNQIPAEINSIVDIEGFEFNYFQTDFTVQYYILPGMYIGSGFSYNQLRKVKSIVKLNRDLYRINESGFIFSIGKMFKNFNLELYYYKGLSKIEIRDFDLYLKPISTFGISLSYDIKVFNKIWRKVDCPKF
ncbi:MAG TPA: hypothetical protein VFG10_17395 [Saprospiraceae bacterium]|nr:hypothetical protein [Saprospiraceae bacterium]